MCLRSDNRAEVSKGVSEFLTRCEGVAVQERFRSHTLLPLQLYFLKFECTAVAACDQQAPFVFDDSPWDQRKCLRADCGAGDLEQLRAKAGECPRPRREAAQ